MSCPPPDAHPLPDREFWDVISRAAFANPFSPERQQLDSLLTGSRTADPARLAEVVSARVARLETAGKASVRAYTGQEREKMRSVFLFEIYHRFYRPLDDLIQAQIKSADQPCLVPFAAEALGLLARRGFPAAEAARLLAVLYQIRRAHFFIVAGLVGQAPSMHEFRRRLWNNVFTHDIRWYDQYLWNRMEDFSTLLLGETGTGKGAAGAAIGRSGFIPFDEKKGCFVESFARDFISLNLSQFPEPLIESELFGHRKGAFTGAIEAHEGMFARCSPFGAIFLDEIGDVSVPIQIKLLEVLQERTFSPVGGHQKLRFRGRVIAATNRPLDQLRQRQLFRDDFFYRLCSDIIVAPPLRQRLQESPEELELSLRHILGRMTGEASAELVRSIRDKLWAGVGPNYPWPGNVRELEQAVRRILLTERYDGDRPGIGRDLRSQLTAGIDAGSWDADAVLGGYCALLYQRHGTLEEVSRRVGLDRRTVKKYLATRVTRQ